MNYKIIKAESSDEIQIIRELFIEYAAELKVDLCFQGFQKELDSLPGKYAEPEGSLLLLEADNQTVGCVALRKIEDGTCEMKRLYLKPDYRKYGFGRVLAEKIIEIAKEKGYKKMNLDTLERLSAAIALYQKLGFIKTIPYNFNPENDVVYFEKEL